MKKMHISHIQPATGTYEDWSPPYISKQKNSSYKNFIKYKMTGRVDIILRIFVENAKKLKLKSQDRKRSFSNTVTFFTYFYFFAFFFKNAP